MTSWPAAMFFRRRNVRHFGHLRPAGQAVASSSGAGFVKPRIDLYSNIALSYRDSGYKCTGLIVGTYKSTVKIHLTKMYVFQSTCLRTICI